MFVDQHKEVEFDLTKPRIGVYKKQLANTPKYSILVQFEGCSREKGWSSYQTRSNAITLYNTLPAVCIEKVVNMMSGEELYSKMYQSPEFPQRTGTQAEFALWTPGYCQL